jgi:hypothetical protein
MHVPKLYDKSSFKIDETYTLTKLIKHKNNKGCLHSMKAPASCLRGP